MTKKILLPEADSLNKDISLSELLVRCDIPGFGEKMSERVANKVKNVVTLRDLIECGDIDKVLDSVSGIGEKSKDSLKQCLKNFEFMILLDELEDDEYNIFQDETIYTVKDLIEDEEDEEDEEEDISLDFLTGLKGYHICITGTLSMPRRYFQNLIEGNGGTFQRTVNKSTDILIYSKKDGRNTSKFKKASDINSDAGFDKIKIITEKTFVDSIKTIGTI